MSDPEIDLPPPTPVSRDSTAGVAVMAHLRTQTAALLAADAGLDEDLPGAVHQSRVAARRLRSGLRLYGDLLVGDVAAGLRTELSWYAGRLSPLRDLEVFVAHLEKGPGTPEDDRVRDLLVPWCLSQRSRHRVDALADLRSARADALRAALVEVARRPAFVPEAAKRAPKVLVPRVLRADQRAERRFSALHAGGPADAWHLTRIAAKRARYAAEVAAPAVGRPAADLARLWTEVTEELGTAQDAVVQRDLVLARVEDAASPLTAEEAFLCGLLVAREGEREVTSHQRALEDWQHARERHARLRAAMSR
jgi:CHAD domain-containing protein